MSVFINKGARSEPASAFLKPAMNRENLHVLTGAHVTRVWPIVQYMYCYVAPLNLQL